ncbi:hypothetical protein, partial [Jonquetella anthropi]|uniref:hypothetical protein n=1 Tax=Jonquetella anthropi TaxID=428712 RepID=UPI0023F0BB89
SFKLSHNGKNVQNKPASARTLFAGLFVVLVASILDHLVRLHDERQGQILVRLSVRLYLSKIDD